MTGKRYLNVLTTGDIKDTVKGELIRGSRIGDLLNELSEENEQLKRSNKDAWNLIQFIYNEIKEDGSMDFGRIRDLVELE